MTLQPSHSEPYEPIVKDGHAFREISTDFTRPAEIFREGIANALDAYAHNMWLRVTVEVRRGREVVIIDIADDGIGMSLDGLKTFLNLSDSQKPKQPPEGMKARRMTGYKGHGTKIYYNSDEVEVLTFCKDNAPVYCRIVDPKGSLAVQERPRADLSEIPATELSQVRSAWGLSQLGGSTGTVVRVIGYHHNLKSGLEHVNLRDYILWFTRWGSWEPKLRTVTETTSDETQDLSGCSLFLRGLGKVSEPQSDEKIPFGHPFPKQDVTDMRALRGKDDSDPLKHYVRTWGFADEPLLNNPDKRIDFLFALEGEGARREYNDMLRRQGKPRRPGDYISEERYGLWIGRDYVPVQRFNSWVAERSEFTRMHAFVNCAALELTANRGSVENTPQELLGDIEKTVRKIFEERVQNTQDYSKFEDELLAVERVRSARKEATTYSKRLKRIESKLRLKVSGVEFLSPASEMDLVALVSGIQALYPDILPFVIRDYDSHFGYDALVARARDLDPSEVEHLFVEFKLELHAEFNHSFEKLDSIVCWRSRLKDGQTVTDLAGQKGTFRISAAGKKKRFIMVESRRNVEVYVFEEVLSDRGLKFKNGEG